MAHRSYMRLPSVKTIRDILRTDDATAKKIRERLEIYRDGREAPSQTLLGIDTLISGHGIEYLASKQDTLHTALGVHYVNMGETYAPTVYFDYRAERFHVGSWGDLVEAQSHRF